MSLIGDALRKTRQEATEREVDRKGVLFSAKIADSPTRSNLGLGLALGAIIAVAATVAGGGAVWWLLGSGNATRPEPSGRVVPVTTTVVETAETPIESLVPTPAATNTQVQAPSAVEMAPTSSTTPNPTDLGLDRPALQPDVVADTAPTTRSQDEGEAEGFAGIEDGDEIYILEADLGNVQLSLDFIVYRSVDPFVEISGVELHVGGVVAGYRVKAIEKDRVRLSNGRRTIVLRAP